MLSKEKGKFALCVPLATLPSSHGWLGDAHESQTTKKVELELTKAPLCFLSKLRLHLDLKHLKEHSLCIGKESSGFHQWWPQNRKVYLQLFLLVKAIKPHRIPLQWWFWCVIGNSRRQLEMIRKRASVMLKTLQSLCPFNADWTDEAQGLWGSRIAWWYHS